MLFSMLNAQSLTFVCNATPQHLYPIHTQFKQNFQVNRPDNLSGLYLMSK